MAACGCRINYTDGPHIIYCSRHSEAHVQTLEVAIERQREQLTDILQLTMVTSEDKVNLVLAMHGIRMAAEAALAQGEVGGSA